MGVGHDLHPPGPSSGDRAIYQLVIDNTWSEISHPGAFPEAAHFSWLGGGIHSERVSFWEEGELASRGMVQMAETGRTDILVEEVDAAVRDGDAFAALTWQWWFCPVAIDHGSCGELTVEFEVDEQFPLVTFVTMLGPSPDWFVGTDGLSLRDGEEWVKEVTVDLRPYDGGLGAGTPGGSVTTGPYSVSSPPSASLSNPAASLPSPECGAADCC